MRVDFSSDTEWWHSLSLCPSTIRCYQLGANDCYHSHQPVAPSLSVSPYSSPQNSTTEIKSAKKQLQWYYAIIWLMVSCCFPSLHCVWRRVGKFMQETCWIRALLSEWEASDIRWSTPLMPSGTSINHVAKQGPVHWSNAGFVPTILHY